MKTKERWFWWHWQNLNEERVTKRKGSGLIHGRAWFYFGRLVFGVSWNLWTTFCHVYAEAGGEGDATFGIALPPVALWFSVEHPAFYEVFPNAPHRVGVSVHHWAIWTDLWQNQHEWSSKRDRWRNFCFHMDDFFLGKQVYSERLLESARTVVPMPEGSYPATVNMSEATWKRPRWFAQPVVRATVTPDKPIPYPGKGENAWDCGESGLHELTTPARSVEEAVSATVASVLRSRRKYGGPNWKPAV